MTLDHIKREGWKKPLQEKLTALPDYQSNNPTPPSPDTTQYHKTVPMCAISNNVAADDLENGKVSNWNEHNHRRNYAPEKIYLRNEQD